MPTPAMTPHELAAKLAAPFPDGEVKLKPKVVKGNRALALHYIDARAVMDRLDEVLGVENWQDAYTLLPDGSVQCTLRVRIGRSWIAKSDVGSPSEQPDSGDRMKAAFSDGLKRAAVRFGIGRYLYGLPNVWVDYDPASRRIIGTPQLPASDPVAVARDRLQAAKTLAELAAAWEAMPADTRTAVLALKETRKAQLTGRNGTA